MRSILLKGTVVFAVVMSMLVGEAVVADAAMAQQTAGESEYGVLEQLYEPYEQALLSFQQSIDNNSSIPADLKSTYDSYFSQLMQTLELLGF